MSTCNICYGRGYYLLTNEEEWEYARCDCQITKEKESK